MGNASMPDLGVKKLTDDTALRERELILKEKEFALKEREAIAKIELEKRGFWFSSPLLIAIFSAIFGLLGTGVGATIQGYSSAQLERQKFEFTLIQEALRKDDKVLQLSFLVDSGVIESLDGEKIRKSAVEGKLPAPFGVTITRRDILEGCIVTVDNTLVSLMSQPDTFSLELIRVKPGEYTATEHVLTFFASSEQGWFKINAEGREGWIANDTWSIAAKSSTCP